jgi:peptidoglycan/LPS O-acetylase OafA/YrhL
VDHTHAPGPQAELIMVEHSEQVHRRPDIQGLRAVAVLMVVAFHAGLPLPGGFVGVDVFFVISGFVITGVLRRQWISTGKIRFGQFYMRRFKRLMPALALVVCVTLAISLFLLSPLGIQQTTAQTGIGAMLFSANLVLIQNTEGYFGALAEANPLLHTWSLSVEEQFYLFFPAFIGLVWYVGAANRNRRSTTRISSYLLVCLLAAVSLFIAFYGVELLNSLPLPHHLTHKRAVLGLLGFYSPLTRSWEFALGVLLAMAADRLVNLGRTVTSCMSAAGLSALLVSLWLISDSTPFPGPWTLVPVVGTVLLLAAGAGASNPVTRALSSGPAVRIGDWSYSIYLWHWPAIVFAGLLWQGSKSAIVIAAVASVIPAVLSYRWVEMPIRNMQPFQGTRALKVVVTTLLAPVLIGASLLFAAGHGYWSQGIQAMQAAVQQFGSIRYCTALNLNDPGYSKKCGFNPGGSNKPIYLVGDSTAWHFSEAAIRAGELLGRPVNLIGNPNCYFEDIYTVRAREDAWSCRRGYEAAMEWLRTQAPGTVIIADIILDGNRDILVGRRPDAILNGDTLATDPARYWDVVDSGLASTIRTLNSFGDDVLLVQAAPIFTEPPKFQPALCTVGELRANNCVGRLSLGEANSIQQFHRAFLARVAAQTGAGLWDPRDFFCRQERCTTQRDGLNLYRDELHISSSASQLLGPSLAKALVGLDTPGR